MSDSRQFGEIDNSRQADLVEIQRIDLTILDDVIAGIVDGDRAAVFSHIVSTQNRTGRTIRYQRAEFFVFQNGKIIAYRSILDSFDIAEQVLGHEIDITPTVRILKAPDVARA